MHKFTCIIISAWMLIFSCAERTAEKGEKLKWMTLQEAAIASQKEKKPLLIDLYTDWCGWCKVMDRKTYSNKKVIEYIQEKFYPVKLNAETKEMLQWNSKTYSFNKDYQANEIALYLTYGKLEFPTTIIIPTDESGPQPVPGYLEPKELELIVRYFGEGKYGKVPFEDYKKDFRASW